jgi:NAD(P)-dependent dehydrogenase (short-subunit alcohol dehydrogenase family)
MPIALIALALAAFGIGTPGIVATPSWDGMPSEQREAFFAALADKLPAGRVGKPEDLAHAVLFLIGNGFTTGMVLHVDGGHRLV